MAVGTFFTVLAGLVAVAALAIYFFGIPPEIKRKMEEKALTTMGENKASYVLKDQISKVPASDQQDIKEFKQGLGNFAGGSVNNPIGKEGGDLADDLTRPFSGR